MRFEVGGSTSSHDSQLHPGASWEAAEQTETPHRTTQFDRVKTRSLWAASLASRKFVLHSCFSHTQQLCALRIVQSINLPAKSVRAVISCRHRTGPQRLWLRTPPAIGKTGAPRLASVVDGNREASRFPLIRLFLFFY